MIETTEEIHRGSTFRAMGGPVFNGNPVGTPGLYRAVDFETINDRQYILAYPVNKFGVQDGGSTLLFVKGEPYELPDLPGWLCQPYRIVTKSGKLKEDVTKTRVKGTINKRTTIVVSGSKPVNMTPIVPVVVMPIDTPHTPHTPAGGARNVMTKIQNASTEVQEAKAEIRAAVSRTKPAGSMSMLDAAAEILKRRGEPMHVRDLTTAMAEAGLWESKAGKTPERTLWAAIPKDKLNRFEKTGPGVFGLKSK